MTENYIETGENTYKVTADVQLVTNLPDYEDPGHTYNSETIQKLEQQVARAQELMDSSMTRQELDVAIGTKYKEIGQLETSLKVAKLDLEKKKSELGDGNVYAEFDGTVKVVRDATEALTAARPWWSCPGGGGYYVTGTLSEMDLGSVQVGDTVQISSWRTGVNCEGMSRVHRRLPHAERQQLGRRQQQRVLLPVQGVRQRGRQSPAQRLRGDAVSENGGGRQRRQPVSGELLPPLRERQELRYGTGRKRQTGEALGCRRAATCGAATRRYGAA